MVVVDSAAVERLTGGWRSRGLTRRFAVNIPRSWYRHNRYRVFNRQIFPGLPAGMPVCRFAGMPVCRFAGLPVCRHYVCHPFGVRHVRSTRRDELYVLGRNGTCGKSSPFRDGIEKFDCRPWRWDMIYRRERGPHNASRRLRPAFAGLKRFPRGNLADGAAAPSDDLERVHP